MFNEVHDLLKNVKTRTIPYHTIQQILFIQWQQEDWDLHLAPVCMAIMSTVNHQNGFTPNFLMLGGEVLQHIDLMLHPGGKEDR